MTRIRDIALIIAAAVLIFFAGSNIDISSGLEENALYIAVMEALQSDQPVEMSVVEEEAVEEEQEDLTADEPEVKNDSADSLEITLESSTSIAYPSGTQAEFTLVIKNLTENEVTITKITDDKFGYLNIDDNKCELSEEEIILEFKIAGKDEFSCTYSGFVKADIGETHTNTISVFTVDDKQVKASANIEISKSISGLMPAGTITLVAKNTWPFINNNVSSDPVNLIVRDQNTEAQTTYTWGQAYSSTSGKSVDISLDDNDPYSFVVEYPSTPSKIAIDLKSKNTFLPPGEYSTNIFIEKPDEPEAANVPVKVVIGYHWGWIFFITAIGVIGTRALFWWKDEKRHLVNWNDLRAKWMDLLSENIGWTSRIPGSSKVMVKRQILKDYQTKIKDTLTWLNNLETGSISIDKVTEILQKAQDLDEYNLLTLQTNRPLSETINDIMYKICSPVNSDGLAKDIIENATVISRDQLFSVGSKNDFYIKNFSELIKTARQTVDKLDDAKKELCEKSLAPIEAAEKPHNDSMSAFEIILKEYSEQIEIKDIATLNTKISALESHFKDFKTNFITPTSSIADCSEISGLIHEVKNYAVKCEDVLGKLDKAKYPGKSQSLDVSEINKEIHAFQETLSEFTEKDIKESFILNKVFSPILTDFHEADQGYNKSDTDFDDHWKKILLKYNTNARVIRSARELGRLRMEPPNDNPHVSAGFMHLLGNKSVEVEVSTQRARTVAQLLPPPGELEKFIRASAASGKLENKYWVIGETLKSYLEEKSAINGQLNSDRISAKYQALEILKLVIQYTDIETDKQQDAAEKIVKALNLPETISAEIEALPIKLIKRLNAVTKENKAYFDVIDWYSVFFPEEATQEATIQSGIKIFAIEGFPKDFLESLWGGTKPRAASPHERTIVPGVAGSAKWADHIRSIERTENRRPFFWRIIFAGTFSSLAVAISTILVIYGNSLFGNLQTWGKPADWLTAFVVGILAERLEKPTTNLIESIAKAIKGEDDDGAKESEAEAANSGTAEAEASSENK